MCIDYSIMVARGCKLITFFLSSGAHYSRDGEAHILGVVSQHQGHAQSQTSGERAKQLDTVNFPLAQLHSIKETSTPVSPGKR